MAAETSAQALHTLNSLGYRVTAEECKTAILHNMESAQRSDDEEYASDHMAKALDLLAATIKEGYFVEEGIYVPLLNYLIAMKMVEKFQIILEILRDGQGIPDSFPEFARFGYYEMLLWIQLKDKEKIKEVCSMIIKSFQELTGGQGRIRFKPSVIRRRWRKTRGSTETITDCSHNRCLLAENYLLALCEKDQHKDVLRILDTLDITRVYSFDILTSIFEHLGRSLSESVAKKLLRELNENDLFYCRKNDVSELIFSYVTSIPNLGVVFGRCEPKHKEGDGYKAWLKENYFGSKLYDYERRCPYSNAGYDGHCDDFEDEYPSSYVSDNGCVSLS